MILPSRLTMILGGASALLLVSTLLLGAELMVTKHDLARETKEADRVPGLVRDLDTCRGNAKGLEASLGKQNAAVAQLAADSARLTREGAERLAAERARTAAAERGRQALLQAQPRAGEDVCAAAFRLHQESLR